MEKVYVVFSWWEDDDEPPVISIYRKRAGALQCAVEQWQYPEDHSVDEFPELAAWNEEKELTLPFDSARGYVTVRVERIM